jgi:A/G-specific adenine glycosylase
MLQQTQVKKVLAYFPAFIQKFPTVEKLASADLQDVLKSWELLGYYARARNLHKAAKMVMTEFNGQIPVEYDDLIRLPGVGEYIASAILSIAYRQPVPVVDGNVRRVLSRLFRLKEPVNDAKSSKAFKKAAVELLDKTRPGDFNQAMMELGALLCRPQNPQCPDCPVNSFCEAYLNKKTRNFPIRLRKKKTPEYRIAAGVIRKKGKILITRREENGLLGGLWEFPGGKLREGESPEQACLREIREEVNLAVNIVSHLALVRHAYTHFKIVVDVFLCEYQSGKVCLNGAVDYRWITVNEIESYPFPAANHKFFPVLRALLT